MKWPEISVTAWKWLISLLALLVAGLLLTQIWYAPRTLAPGAASTLGMQYHEVAEWGPARYVIDEVAVDSPMLAAGARVGDIWYPERYYDAWRHLSAGEPIALTLLRDGTARQLTITTVPNPIARDASLYMLNWLIAAFAVLIGLVVGYRQPRGVAFRAFSLAGFLLALLTTFLTYRALPAGALFVLQDLCWRLARWTSTALFMLFVFNFPDDQPRNTALKRWLLRYAVPVFAVVWLAANAVYLLQATGQHAPWYGQLRLATPVLGGGIILLVMWNNWHSSRGELRQRHLWILLTFFAFVVETPVLDALYNSTSILAAQAAAWIAILVGISGMFTFAYAILRHRIIPIGFAVNRAVVYGAASMGLLLSFGVIEWAAHHLLSAFDHEMPMVLNLLIAIGVFLVFHRVRHAGENLIERLFFHAWHMREQGLRKFVQQAPFITRSESLASALAEALRQFTEGAGQALYRRDGSGNYERMTATLNDAPEQIDADDSLLVALRAEQQPSFCSDTASGLPGELAIPSIHHGQLDGFVLLGNKPNGDTYRPDELEALGHAAHQVGLDFRALRMEELEREVPERIEKLEREIAELSARNQGYADLLMAFSKSR